MHRLIKRDTIFAHPTVYIYACICVRFHLAKSSMETLWRYHPEYLYIYIYIYGILQAIYLVKEREVSDVSSAEGNMKLY